MPKEEAIKRTGIVEEIDGLFYQVRLEEGAIVRATLSGRMKMMNIRVAKGDSVEVEVSPYDLKKGRITVRKRWHGAGERPPGSRA